MSDLKNKNDIELMYEYQKGDESAFRELFERYNGRVYRYLSSKVFNKNELNDVFQNVFMKFHQSKHLYNEKYSFEAWFFTISKTVLIDYFRKNKKNAFEIPDTESIEESTIDVDPLLKKLPKQNQDILQLRYFEDSTFEEIAAKIDKTPGNVRKIISRSLKALRSLAGDSHET